MILNLEFSVIKLPNFKHGARLSYSRFVSNNFRRKASVSEMLHNLGWQSLDSRRQDQRLVLFYKIINRLASVETEDILTPADSRTRKNHSFKFKHLQANCDSYRYSFFSSHYLFSSWNNLPFGIEKVGYLLQDTSVCSVNLLNWPGHHEVYTISFHVFLHLDYYHH